MERCSKVDLSHLKWQFTISPASENNYPFYCTSDYTEHDNSYISQRSVKLSWW